MEAPAQPMKPGFHNPPVQWYKDHGPTDGCYACEGLKKGVGTKGRVHSAKCKARWCRLNGDLWKRVYLRERRLGDYPWMLMRNQAKRCQTMR